MSNQYEIEHNIKAAAKARHTRRPDMSSFRAFLDQLSAETPTSSNTPFPSGAAADGTHNNRHAVPTPNDMADLFRLVQDQFMTLSTTSPSDANRDFLRTLVEALEADIDHPPERVSGADQAFLDRLDRVPKKQIKKEDACPICAERFLDDAYPLVVELPCHATHRFDLECVAPWLQSKGTCPMCRKDLVAKKAPPPPDSEDDEDDPDGLYA